MDSADLDKGSHHQALRGLARINSLSLGAGRIWKIIRARQDAGQGPFRVLDVACGGGDVALSLKRRAVREGVDVEVWGCDVHPVAVEYAEQAAGRLGLEVGFFQHDALAGPPPGEYDLVCSSLFLHHLSGEEAAGFLRTLGSAGAAVLVQDLLRTRLGYFMALTTTRVVTRSGVVHVDGPRSVRAAFSMGEIHEMAGQAGLRRPKLDRCWPERFCLFWEGS
jgi:2-polyprenyl-3-methyl-5-hydroxy-6-metoxy-1,4-benzoquinol methylase